jgi:hypothetical protein
LWRACRFDLESEHQIPSVASFQDSAAISIVVHAGVSDIFVTTIQSTGVAPDKQQRCEPKVGRRLSRCFDRDKSSPATIDAGYS